MIVLDIETSGLDPHRNALLSIGAVDYANGEEFYIECRAGSELELDDAALAINGFTREQVSGVWAVDNKPFRDIAYIRFLQWVKGREPLLAGQQVGAFDIPWIKSIHTYVNRAERTAYYNEEVTRPIGPWPFGHRSVDLHSVAFAKLGKSLSLDGILQAVGLAPEPKPHNALTGAKLEVEAFKRLL